MTDKLEFEEGLSQDYWIREFHKISFPGMELFEVTFFRKLQEDFIEKQIKFKRMAEQFLKKLGTESKEELESFGFSEEQISLIARGRLPENYVVHLKYPFEYGSVVNFENMVLMPNIPYHMDIHAYIERQLITDSGIKKPYKLYVPTPVGRIYNPSSGDGSSGGHANANISFSQMQSSYGR